MNKVIIARRVVEDVAKIANKEREIIIATLERLQQDPFTNVYSEQLITHPNAPHQSCTCRMIQDFFSVPACRIDAPSSSYWRSRGRRAGKSETITLYL